MVKLLDYVFLEKDGEVLKSRDVCQVIMIERGTKDKPYYCWCENKEVGEFFNEQDLKNTNSENRKLVNQIHK
jgi:hypothetical protein